MAATPTTVVTGASGGLGKALSIELARRGRNVLMIFRDLGQAELIHREVVDKSGNGNARLMIADLASLDEVRRLARDIAEDTWRACDLVHTAAIYTATRRVTPDGLEAMFAVNHLAPYLLTRALLPVLDKSAPARVVLVSAPSSSVPDFDDLQSARNFRSFKAFGVSKSGNLLFAFALARRAGGPRLAVNAFHPGLMKSGLTGEMPGPLRVMLNIFSRQPESAARYLADIITGKLSAPNGAFVARNKLTAPPKITQQLELQERMWRVSAELTGLPPD